MENENNVKGKRIPIKMWMCTLYRNVGKMDPYEMVNNNVKGKRIPIKYEGEYECVRSEMHAVIL